MHFHSVYFEENLVFHIKKNENIIPSKQTFYNHV